MASSLSRIQIVQAAVLQAGRGAELNDHAKLLLNALLRDQAMKFRYPCLRKVGDQQTLSASASSVAVPSDLGAGTEALLFGGERLEIVETAMHDFIRAYGFTKSDQQASRPTAFMLDEQAQLFRFNAISDAAYPFIPIYFYLPADLSLDASDDNSKLWYANDLAIIQGLIWAVYQYTDDAREASQRGLFEKMDADYRRGAMPKQAGGQRLKLSSGAFRPRVRR